MNECECKEPSRIEAKSLGQDLRVLKKTPFICDEIIHASGIAQHRSCIISALSTKALWIDGEPASSAAVLNVLMVHVAMKKTQILLR